MKRHISEFNPMTLDELICFINSKLEEYDISQRELAEYVGVTEVSMSRWLNQKRKMPFEVASKCLKRFCYAFACYDLRNSGWEDSEA